MIVQDFSENYNCLLPDEPQSIHWTIQQATVYPVVTLRCHNKKIVEDHFVFISDDRTHDSPFVVYCDDHIKEFYSANYPNITSFIELNDGCAQQFKSIKAISQLSRRPYYLSRLYFETSHGKSKSDGLGGVVKSFVSRSVKVPLQEMPWNFINSGLKISLFEIMTVLLVIVVSFLPN